MGRNPIIVTPSTLGLQSLRRSEVPASAGLLPCLARPSASPASSGPAFRTAGLAVAAAASSAGLSFLFSSILAHCRFSILAHCRFLSSGRSVHPASIRRRGRRDRQRHQSRCSQRVENRAWPGPSISRPGRRRSRPRDLLHRRMIAHRTADPPPRAPSADGGNDDGPRPRRGSIGWSDDDAPRDAADQDLGGRTVPGVPPKVATKITPCSCPAPQRPAAAIASK